jgi:hypothetical protein
MITRRDSEVKTKIQNNPFREGVQVFAETAQDSRRIATLDFSSIPKSHQSPL